MTEQRATTHCLTGDAHRLAAVQLPGDAAVYVNGDVLVPGTEVSIRGKRGRFRYLRATTTGDGQLVFDFIGGTSGRERWHSFYPDRITRIHGAKTMRRFNKRGTRVQ
jgi:hypothetical protein